MKTMIAGVCAGVVLLAAGSAMAQTINSAGMTGPEVVAWLQNAGYKAELKKDSEGDPMISSAAQGVNFTVYFYDCDGGARCRAIQFSAGFDMKTPPTVQKINEWNRDKRYLKAYLDSDGDPRVEYDVNVNAGRTMSGLNDDFGVWTRRLADFKTFIGF